MVVQQSAYGLGNFINLTPTIRAMADKLGNKIPVKFESDYVAQCYKNSKWIETVKDVPFPLFGSNEINQKIPDWEYVYTKFYRKLDLAQEIPHSFIDTPPILPCDVVVANGTANEGKSAKRLQPNEFRTVLSLLRDRNVIFVGSQADIDFSKKELDYFGVRAVKDNMYRILGYIRGCNLFISNATGFYHAAGALKKKQIIFWRDCNKVKNRNPNCHQKELDLHKRNVFRTYQRTLEII